MISTLVIGGGIGGLSLARELAIRNLPVTVLERAPQLNPVGAGIIMNPNAMRLLERNGLANAVRAESWPYLLRETRDARGRLLAVRDYLPLYDSGKLARGALVHRAHLLDVLWKGVPKESVHFGIKVEGISVYPDRVKIDTPQKSFEADILVGADGIHSQVRRHLFGEMQPRYMGYRSHRLVVDNVAGTQQFTEYLGDGQRIGLVPISPARIYVWTTFNSAQHRPPELASADDWRALFAQFTDSQVKRALGEVRSAEEIITTDIEELELERWSKGRAGLLGDAAHAMTPNIGQGAGMAMEDAAVLAEELARASRPEEALQNYERRRRPRIETVMRISREVGEDGQRSGRIACWLRNRRIRREGRDVRRVLADLERLLAYSG